MGTTRAAMRHGTRTLALAIVLATATAAGGCGGASEEDRVRDAVEAYISGTAHRDGGRVCDAIAKATRIKAAQAQEDAGEEGGCAQALAASWKRTRPVVFTTQKTTGVRVDGERARAIVEGVANGIRQREPVTLVREDGAWHVSTLGRARTPDGRPVLRSPTDAMRPTLRAGDQFVVDERAYASAAPKVGDVVVAHPPLGSEDTPCPGRELASYDELCVTARAAPSETLVVKRVVAGPGDRITFRGGHAVVDGRRMREPFADTRDCAEDQAVACDYRRAITVPAGRFYLVGDNRGNSSDSRMWGAVGRAQITGRVVR